DTRAITNPAIGGQTGRMKTGPKQLRVRQGGNISQIHPRSTFTWTNFDQIRLNPGKSDQKNYFSAVSRRLPSDTGLCPPASAFRPPLPLSRRSAAKADPLPPVKSLRRRITPTHTGSHRIKVNHTKSNQGGALYAPASGFRLLASAFRLPARNPLSLNLS